MPKRAGSSYSPPVCPSTPSLSLGRRPVIVRSLLVRSLLISAGLCATGCLKIPPEGAMPPKEESLDREELDRVEIWPGKPVGELYAVGEVRAFAFHRKGALVARSWGRYDGPTTDTPPLHRFSTRVEITIPGREPQRSAGEIVLDDAGQLVRGFEQRGPTRLHFRRDGQLLKITDGHQEESLKAGPDAAYMAFGAIFHEELMLGLRPIKSGTLGWRMVSLSGSLPVNWSAEVEVVGEPNSRPKVARLNTSFGEAITFESGRIKAIDIADGEQTIRPTGDAWPSWQLAPPRTLEYAPSPDASFTRREIKLAGRPGEPALAGEILLPKKTARRPRPAALFLSGTGRQDRYGFAGPPPVDLGAHTITDALAEAGFVVLRFDERGQGASEEGPRSWDLQLEDARRALRTLLVQEEVDPDRIAIIGHGEGGWRALRLDAEDRGVSAIALLATPGRPYRALLDEQAEIDIEALPPELRERAREEHTRMMAALETGQDLPQELAREAEWARGLLRIDPNELIRRGHAPLFVAQGDRDFEVDPDRDPQALQSLARRHKRPLALHRYPGLDHLFKLETKTSSPARYFDPDGPREVDASMLRDLTEWLLEITSRGAKAKAKTKAKTKTKTKTKRAR